MRTEWSIVLVARWFIPGLDEWCSLLKEQGTCSHLLPSPDRPRSLYGFGFEAQQGHRNFKKQNEMSPDFLSYIIGAGAMLHTSLGSPQLCTLFSDCEDHTCKEPGSERVHKSFRFSFHRTWTFTAVEFGWHDEMIACLLMSSSYLST